MVLESSHVSCTFCKCKLAVEVKSNKEKGVMSVYTRNGTKFAKHQVKRCQNNDCRAGHFHGYTVKNNVRRYDPDVLQKNEFLGTSNH